MDVTSAHQTWNVVINQDSFLTVSAANSLAELIMVHNGNTCDVRRIPPTYPTCTDGINMHTWYTLEFIDNVLHQQCSSSTLSNATWLPATMPAHV